MPQAPKDPSPVTIAAGQTTTVDLGAGADLIIPPGAMTAGAKVHATYSGSPSGAWNGIRPIAAPVELVSDPPNAIHGLLILEFPVPAPPAGVDPAGAYGISTFDLGSHAWTPYPSTYDAARHMIVAQIPHFSWWNPYSWDWASIGARVNQNVGQLLGRRASPPSCPSGPPSWVSSLPGVGRDAALAVRSCAQAQGDILDVEMVNNRPYGMVMEYGSAVKWGWHQDGDSAKDKALYKLADALIGPGRLYLPPLGRASVGIYRPPAGQPSKSFRIASSFATLYVDYVDQAADFLVGKIPDVGSCTTVLAGWVSDNSFQAIRDDMVSAGDCLVDSYKREVASGRLDAASVEKLAATLSALKKASIVGKFWTVYGIEWQLGDLYVDTQVIKDPAGLGAGFSVFAHNDPSPPQTVGPTTPANQAPPPSKSSPAPPPPVTTTAPVTSAPPPPPVTTTTPAPPPQPPAAYHETVGGPTHTWTNYTNAGGTEGPTIPTNQTVQIACKLTGFRVADGNTWWYRIAASPWNGMYYASADAFYNNGQTSGSLHGTPFVDPNVPNC